MFLNKNLKTIVQTSVYIFKRIIAEIPVRKEGNIIPLFKSMTILTLSGEITKSLNINPS